MLRTVAAAASDPVTLIEAKQHLIVEHGDHDALIGGLIKAATLQAQAITQRLFVTQTVEWVLPGWQPRILLPIAPVAKDGVVSIKYVDWATQAEATLDPSRYVVQPCGPTVKVFPTFGSVWPIAFPASSEPVVIRFNAGTEPADVPANVKTAIMMIVAHHYNNRESVVVGEPGVTQEVPQGVSWLLMSEVW